LFAPAPLAAPTATCEKPNRKSVSGKKAGSDRLNRLLQHYGESEEQIIKESTNGDE